MMDTETETLWCHILGQAMEGKHKDHQLSILPAELTTWESWRTEHPETTVLNLSRTHDEFTGDFYEDPDKFVYGWRTGAKTYACSFTTMRKEPVQNLEVDGDPLLLAFDVESQSPTLFSRQLAGLTHRFRLEVGALKDEKTGSLWNSSTGECIGGELKGRSLDHVIGIVSFTRSWFDFHPDTELVGP